MLHFYPLNELISNLMLTTGLKKLTRGQQRAEKARHFEKIKERKGRDVWPSMMTQTLNVCSAFNPSKGTHTAVNTHPEQWPAIYLCSIINKILAHTIRKSFSFNLIQI